MNETHAERLETWNRDHRKAVRGFLLASVRRSDVAEELCQEVFCRAWQGRERYAEQGKPRAYLLQIAHRLLVDRGRRNEPQTNLDDKTWRACEPPGTGPDPADAAELREETRRLCAALDRLSPMQQRVLLLRYYGQMEFQEIADTVEAPLSTTLSHCRRGLEALRKLLVEKKP
jgi:RNA polymerase sigma-70 factor (ECF subfamily)